MYAIFAFPIFEYNDIRQKYGHAWIYLLKVKFVMEKEKRRALGHKAMNLFQIEMFRIDQDSE